MLPKKIIIRDGNIYRNMSRLMQKFILTIKRVSNTLTNILKITHIKGKGYY